MLRNAPSVLDEILVALEERARSGRTCMFYLSQFPLTEGDAALLVQVVGAGRVVIQAGGPTATVWRESSTSGVWWGEYHNGPKNVALRTIEVTPFPHPAGAPPEDIAGAAAAMRERLECTKPA